MASTCLIITRGISTTSACCGKRNFRKFMLYGKRGSKLHKERQAGPNPELPVHKRGVRDIGYKQGNKYIVVPEMIPEIIVPSLEGFKLKPYVTYQSGNVIQGEFTPRDLFDAVYSRKIVEDFKNGKLNENGEPLYPSEEEKLTAEEAKILAAKTGADMFEVDKDEVIKLNKEKQMEVKLKAAERYEEFQKLGGWSRYQ